ncbi:TPR-like protein [Cucurbitaria berberidis CBS 394.84]|uniref:TPR-like protein n=1 Tax=Cucurbitaria berberidis CBS 394.84 TaxID=1168544 RepID=A0A9P4GQX3_9PLEO|nr:TPR-like protein [Cucurbitaria berberidis CBS 394.84]KAF1850065.1 TPR-like protein [Cucurbitaria berberidis CBS 394.84]
MAEALAVVGIVANIIQLVDFGSHVLNRLEEYQSMFGDIPEAFRHIKAELPVLLDALSQTQSSINARSMREESKTALIPAIEGCRVQIKLLDDVITIALPVSNDSWVRKSGKAFKSLRYDAKVERVTAVIRGYVQTLTYHATVSLEPLADRTPVGPTPSSTVPFRRDPHFVDRQMLAEIDCRSQKPASRLALVGLGGVGKSQLAVEHSYRIRQKSPTTWVFWVHASCTSRFIESYRKIAERAKLPRWDQQDVDILMLVYSWLSNEENGRWLMIIDNADDVEVFTSRSTGGRGNQEEFASKTAPTLLDAIPQSSNGSILITSRSRDVAFRLTGNYSDIIRVHQMEPAHALTLLRNQLKHSFRKNDAEQDGVEQEDAAALVEALDYMPLAISQAAAYISQRAPRATVSKYLQDLLKGDQERARLLHMDLGDTRRDGTASNSIIATWQISFEHIRRERPAATRLLSLMSLFNRQGIPESLLGGRYHDGGGSSGDFEDDLNMLLSFSLIATDVDGHHFQMHRLVQFSTTKWLELQGDLEGWKKKYVRLIDDNYPDSKYENWEACQALFPHAQAAVACRPNGGTALTTWASVLSKAMVYAYDMGYYQEAEGMGRPALEARESTLGREHPYTLSSVSSLAVALRIGGKYEEAEMMLRRALQGREKVLGPKDPLTLSDLNSLGLVLSERGDYEGAERIHRRALQAQEKVLGLEHPSTLQSVDDLGVLLTKRGNYEEAELMHRRALQRRSKVLGLEHKSTLASMDNLGLALGKQCKLDEAEAMHRRALEGSERTFGERHPDTLICARNLASVLGFLDRYAEAEYMHRRVLDDSLKVLGEEHPFTLYSFCNLGSVLHSQGKDQEAEATHRQALARREKVLGREHPHTLSSMHNLAKALKGLSCNQDALFLMQSCFLLRKKVLGPLHPDTKKSHKALSKWGHIDYEDIAWEQIERKEGVSLGSITFVVVLWAFIGVSFLWFWGR